jgi:lipopolysaccharide transport system permease protein
MDSTGADEALAGPVTVYTAGSQLRDPIRLARAMLRDLAASRELAWRLLVRNLSERYRQTVLRYTWTLLPTLLTTLTFTLLHEAGHFTVAKTAAPYGVFVLCGMTLWQAFADALVAPTRMISQSINMVTRVQFPREALVLAGAGEVVCFLVIRMTLLIAVILWSGVPLHHGMILVPLGVVALISLGIAFGLLLTPFAVLYQDVSHGLPFIISLWMFATPVFYPLSEAGLSSSFAFFNPVTPLLDTTRAWILAEPAIVETAFLWLAPAALCVLIIGWLVYRLGLSILIERMSA